MTGYVSDGASWRPFVSGGFTVGTPAGSKAVDVGYVSDGATWRVFYQRQLAAPSGFACTNPGAHPVDLTWAWNAVPNATTYNLYYRANNTGSWILYGSTAGLTYSTPGCSADTAYGWCVTASAEGQVTSEVSNVVQIATGHHEQRNINSLHYSPMPATASWRSGGGGTAGWGVYGGDNIFQGWYGNSGNYNGVITHNGTAFRDWCVANYGQQVYDYLNANNGAWTECAIYVQRVAGSGVNMGAQNGRWNVTNAVVWQGSGPFPYAGGLVTGALSDGQGGWVWLTSHWAAHVLQNQAVEGMWISSFMLEWNDTNAYIQYYGAGHGAPHTQLSARASWNFVTVNQQNSYYW